MDTPLTSREKRRVGINLLIRFGCFGYVTWWFVTHWDSMPVWGVAIYAFVDLVLLFQPLMLVVGWAYLQSRGHHG